MGEALLKHLLGHRVYVDSVGVRAGEIDPFVIEVMDEIGIDVSKHRSKSFDVFQNSTSRAMVRVRSTALCWASGDSETMRSKEVTFDPTLIEGSREARLQAYRGVRDQLKKRIAERFTLDLKPSD